MFKLTRAFVIAAAVSSSVLCAPVPQDVGKPISTGQSADPSATASIVFGPTPQNPNYQSRPTGLCIVPALAKDAGLSQGQEPLTVQQAIKLCPEASTVTVSSKNSKRDLKDPNIVPPAPSPTPEPHPDAPHPVRSVGEHPPNAEVPPKPTNEPLPDAPQPPVARGLPPQSMPVPQLTPEPLPGAPQPHVARDLPPQHQPEPSPLPSPVPQPKGPHSVAARSDDGQPPKVETPPQPSPKPQSDAPQPHAARDVPLHPVPEPQPSPMPLPDTPRPVTVRSESEPHLEPQAAPQPSPQPDRQPGAPHAVTARSTPNAEVPHHAQPLPATMPRPSQLV
ncbi:unnamed protein product [Rhizoctonia solani]|uniref:Uncharacterized protein n=1 Tax=Rhizoctonia solani TaxID=456999 RepID=A0A8H3BEI9_9AGAM|nr:unnamed protein product [Rhizoctonia solani]CAE6455821.1 unnamed protein product [Rhizoctonia solani]